MDFLEIYNLWMQKVGDDEILSELNKISGKNDEIKERFYKQLEFGTAGMRGIMGAGTNRLNIYTVRLASQALSTQLIKNFQNPSVAISYDSRNNSKKFAIESASVFAANNVKVYIVDRLQPTPVLSFCTRYLGCSAGVMITASHNTSEYNGYKCYGSDGAQMISEDASKIYDAMLELNIFDDVKTASFEDCLNSGKISYIKDSVYDEFLKCVLSRRIEKNVDFNNLNVVYTPLNGTGKELVTKVFDKIGVKNLKIVESQKNPDGDFKTCPYPNPEVPQAFDEALKIAKSMKNAPDVLVGTDPDCDRLGAMVLQNGEYRLLCGNEIGVLLSNYVISRRIATNTCPKNAVLVKTVVSSRMIDKICQKYGVEVVEVPIGFKYVGAEMRKLEQKGQLDRFIFGFEESHGYLTGTHSRDKDAVEASMLFLEMASYYKKSEKTLIDVLDDLCKEFGFYSEKTLNFKFEGFSGSVKIENIMSSFRKNSPSVIANVPVAKVVDFKSETSKIKANMLVFYLNSDGKHHEIIVRPSGTEPKIKIYVMCEGTSKDDSQSAVKKISEEFNKILSNF